ncbi:MAG: hypothetical protein U5L01_16880 [Rheinheimera sp.]|nr:hypothetical protein [Rheinheimera sp.]
MADIGLNCHALFSVLVANAKKWLTLGGIATARLPSGESLITFLYCLSTRTPQCHSIPHRGLEMTLVLAGEMVDEQGRYVPGD